MPKLLSTTAPHMAELLSHRPITDRPCVHNAPIVSEILYINRSRQQKQPKWTNEQMNVVYGTNKVIQLRPNRAKPIIYWVDFLMIFHPLTFILNNLLSGSTHMYFWLQSIIKFSGRGHEPKHIGLGMLRNYITQVNIGCHHQNRHELLKLQHPVRLIDLISIIIS